MAYPEVVTREEWLAARKRLLATEKEHTRSRDALNAERRRLPMVRIDKEYVFEGTEGKVTLAGLFGDSRQLIVQHVMFDPDWDAACPGCTASIDEVADGMLAHVRSRDTAFVLLSVAGAGAALVSDWFIAALDPAVESLGISKAFTGLVIVGIAGNAVENTVGITLAAKGKSDLAVSVIKNSVAQIAVFLYPVLVIVSLAFSHRLTFVVNPVLTVALVLTAIAVWAITGDGKATAFEGWSLAGLYVILATLVWYE